jgi:hypothetical protein
MALRLPRAAEREFIAAANIQAVYVAALPSGPSFVSTSRDLLHLLIALRRRWNGIRIISAHWVEGKTEAWLNLPRGQRQPATRRAWPAGGERQGRPALCRERRRANEHHADRSRRRPAPRQRGGRVRREPHPRGRGQGRAALVQSGLSDVAARGQGGRPLDDVCRSTRAVAASNVSRSAVVRVRRSFKIHFPTAANIKFGLTDSNRGCSPHARRRAAKCA